VSACDASQTGGPRFLFVPVSGPGGAGEYFRSLAIAHAVARRWLDAQIHFVVSREASYVAEVPYPVTLIDGSPTRDTAAVLEALSRLRPDVAVFDSAGRAAQLRAAVAQGTRCVYISSRFKTRWKGFRLRRMRYLDQHWIMSPEFLGAGLGWLERWKLRLAGRPKVLFLPTCYEQPTAATEARALERFQVARGEYVLFCPGGAGRFSGLAHGPTVFLAAAAVVRSATGLPTVLVGASDPAGGSQLHAVPVLPNDELMALAGNARLCVVNGGSLLIQCLAQRAVCVAAPIAGDQAARIAVCARRGLIVAAPFVAEGLAAATLATLADPGALRHLHQAVEALDLKNGVDAAVVALAELLPHSVRSK
jgi:hypothetical protein